jgi:hypothetical protein
VVSPSGWLVQVLLPLYDNNGRRFGEEAFARTRTELLERFGGVTAHQQAPARGLWKTGEGEVANDEVVIFEVMCEELDRPWWDRYRQELQRRFKQDVIVIRAIGQEIL